MWVGMGDDLMGGREKNANRRLTTFIAPLYAAVAA